MERAQETDAVAVVGGGLAGSLMALYLARRGMPVEVYEYREDMRRAAFVGGRSINLALSARGLHALAEVGLEEQVRALCIPMRGRMIHARDGAQSFQPYGEAHQYINSISRAALNALLMDEAEAHPRVRFHFQQKCHGFSRGQGTVRLTDMADGRQYEVKPRTIIGADGAFSAVRERMQKSAGFNFSQDYLAHGYKELTIPPAEGGGWRIEREALHIWPRQNFMLIALPNLDGSFTCTLFLPLKGATNSFEALITPRDIEDFFAEHFVDARALIPDLVHTFQQNPTGTLATMRCAPYHFEDKAVIIGDAAHAVVPFYGQGMNASFEDCALLNDLLTRHHEDFERAYEAFSRTRKPDADAIADLALYNYVEMRALVTSPWFLARKKLDKALHRAFPDQWIPLYTMVTFTTMPYAQARARAERQDALVTRALPLLITALAVALVALLVWLLA